MKKLSLILFTLVFIGILHPLISLAEDYLSTEDPNIIIASDGWMPVFKAGENATLSIPYENTSYGSAKDATISIVMNDPEKVPFKPDRMSLTNYALYIGNGSYSSSFKVNIPANTKPGIYPITVTISYSSARGARGSVSSTVYVKIINENKQPTLKLLAVDLGGDNLLAGSSREINLQCKNDGDLNIKDIELRLSGFTPEGINLEKSSDIHYIDSIKARIVRSVGVTLHVNSNLKTGTYALDLNMKYKDDNDREYTETIKVYIPVVGKGEQDDSIPRIIIDQYTYGGDFVLAGQDFGLNLSLINTSQTAVKNIKVSLTSDGQIFSPVSNSNSFYINKIEPQERVEKILMFRAKLGAENQTYVINTSIDYQDSKGEKLNEKEVISIPVVQQIRLMASAVELPPEIFVDNPMSLSVEFYNAGRSIIRNLTIQAEGDFESRDGELYIGNLEAGKSDTYDVTITPHMEGKLEGRILFKYEDDAGKPYELEKKLNLQAITAPAGPFMEMNQPPVPSKQKLSSIWMISIGVVIVLLTTIAIIIIRKRRKAKLEEVDFDE
ncbi:MAG: hypothetical protein CVU90_08245 [Firmicutes bacterium HGW-Firmicutes-15]|nr:MAG: hypothetical protein CVU90_08245 [Firmicutes bacterium HGW-Firmicutes-15]